MSQLPALIERGSPRESSTTSADSSPIIRIQKAIFAEAATVGASDIHIEPGRISTRVRCRVHGALRQTAELPRWLHDNLVVRIKVMAQLDVAERQLRRTGTSTPKRPGRMTRACPQFPAGGARRLLSACSSAQCDVSCADWLPKPFEEKLQSWILAFARGILFVVGPTGSGKTTTLYGLINELRNEPMNVVTIEDPIEYEVDGITQIQTHDRIGITFPRAARHPAAGSRRHSCRRDSRR
jgi:general secretion pathway protein E